MKKIVSLVLLAGVLVLTGFSTGCSLCCAPYDYCGPVFANGCCANLARQRCGTAFNGGCATCGMHGEQGAVDQNGQPIPQAAPQQQGTIQQVPATVPATAPATAPTSTQALPAPSVTQTGQPQYRSASTAQIPVVTADASQQVTTPAIAAPSVPTPENGTIAVDSSGYARVAVYDENNQLLGYEMVDSTGKSVQQVPAPASAQ